MSLLEAKWYFLKMYRCTLWVVLPAMESLAAVIDKYAFIHIDKGDAALWIEFKVELDENPSNETKL